MQARFAPANLWSYLRSTYWFLPSLITLGCVGLAFGVISLDRHTADRELLPGWLTGGGSDGAREILSSVAGSIMTVVSVTFSVTIVALTVASQHFGPRLLNNFMRDAAVQVVLGIFIGTFVYCLLVLRTVQGENDHYERFIPHLGVAGAVVLTLVSVGALIFYVHHVAMAIQVSQIARNVARDFEAAVDRLFPEELGREVEGPESPPAPPATVFHVPSRSSGYVQHIEPDRILTLATRANVVVWLKVRPGDFATEGLALAVVNPTPAEPQRFCSELNGALIVGTDRTPQQDAGFPLDQLVEVALHALSTGVNEPFTAVTCIDRIGQGLAKLAMRRIPSALRLDEEGNLRIISPKDTFVELLDSACNPIRANAAESPEVGVRLLYMLIRLAGVARRPEDRSAIGRQAGLLSQSMEKWRQDAAYRERVDGLSARLRDLLGSGQTPGDPASES
jgi:uncharacterized membrane protein